LSPALLAVLLVAISTLLSTFLATNYPYEVLLGRGLLILSLTVIFIAGSTLAKAETDKPYLYVLSLSAIVLSVISFLQNVGWGPSHLLNMISGLNIPNNALFNVPVLHCAILSRSASLPILQPIIRNKSDTWRDLCCCDLGNSD
jgi:amino acid permease